MLEDLAAEMKQEQDRNEKISSSAVQSYGVNPDQHAGNVKLARKAGMPPALMPEINEDARLRVLLDQIDQAPPAVTRFVSDPENLKASHDDLDNMSAIERTFDVLKKAGRSLASVPWRASSNIAGVLQAAGEIDDAISKPLSDLWQTISGVERPEGALTRYAKSIRSGAKVTADDIKGDNSGAGIIERGLYSGIESLGQNLLTLPLTIMTGSAAPMLMSMSAMSGGEGYGTARDKGKGIAQSLIYGGNQAGIEYLTEVAPALLLVKNLKAKTGLMKFGRDMLASEVPNEQYATALQDLNEWAVLNPTKPFADYVAERPAAAVETLIATIVGTGGMVVTAKGLEKIGASVDKYQTATDNKNFLLALGDGVQASKLRERMPEKLQELIRLMKDEHGTADNVYADAEKLTELWQSEGLDPKQKAAEMFSNPDGYFEALAAKSRVAIPFEEFTEKFTGEKYYQALVDDVQFGDGTLSYNEALEWDKTGRDQAIKDLLAEVDNFAPTPSDMKVYDDVLGQLIGTGMERGTAHRNALIMKAVFRTLGQRTGQDAHELFKEYGLKVTRPLPEVLAKRLSVDMSLDPLLDKLREGKIPKDRDVRGKSLTEYLRKTGVRDDGGELAALEPDTGIKGKAKKLIKADGLEMDRARLVAIEDGYLPEGATIRDFLDAISNDLAGRGVYSGNNLNNQLMEDQLSLTQMKEYLEAHDIDLEAMTNEEIRAILDKHGIKYAEYGERFDEAARHEVAAQLREELQASGQKVLFQSAYHGSPHTFDKFSTSAIGTGEGAQAYGWGLYFASNKEVAEYYKGQLSPFESTFNGEKLPYNLFDETHPLVVAAKELIGKNKYLLHLVNDAIIDIGVLSDKEINTLINEPDSDYQKNEGLIVDLFKKMGVETKRTGKMYHVELAPKEDDEYLLYDAPLKEQSAKVRDALSQASLSESSPDSVTRASEFISDTLKSETFISQGFGGLNIPTQFRVLDSVFLAAQDSKVLDSIIGLIPVDVVDVLSSQKLTPEMLLHDKTMLHDLLGPTSNKAIPSRIDAATALMNATASEATKNILTTRIDSGTFDFGSTNDTSQGKHKKSSFDLMSQSIADIYNKNQDITGGDFYKEILNLLGGRANDKWASEYLHSLGIRGIKYADGNTRNKAEQNFNYVIFSDDDVTITEMYQKQAEQKRGFIRFGADRQFNIGFLENADLSTFIHETGHFYFEVLGDLASKENAPQQIRDDFQKLLEHVGADSRENVTTEQHETLARSFEAYLMEGKAPSVELQSVFARMKAWLVQVYKEIRKLNVKLNDDVRGVFDRLVASDEEIEAARARQGLKEVFASAEDMGVSEAEFQIYRKQGEKVHAAQIEKLEKEYMAEMTRLNQQWWNDGLAKMAAEVSGETEDYPVYIAIQVLTKGVTFAGEVAELKLDRKTLEKQYGKTLVKRLPRGIYAKEGGLSADQVAEMTGFESGQEMIEAMITAPSRKEYVKSEADRRMRALHGDMLTDGSAADEATLAVHTDEQAKVLHEELRAMRKLQTTAEKVSRAKEGENRTARKESLGAIPPAEFFKDLARDMVAKKMIEELLPHRYQQAEAKAAREAFEAAAKKDWAKAAEAKQRQILNHYLYKEAAQIKKMVDKQVGKWNDLVKKSDKRLAASRDMNIVTAARAVLASYGIGDSPDKALAALNLVQQYDPNLYESLQMAVDVATQEPKPWKKLQLTEFIGLMDAVNNLWHLSRRSKVAMIDGLAVGLDEINDDLHLQIGGRARPFSGMGKTSAVTDLQKLKIGFLGMGAALKRVEHWTVEMDRGDSGPFHNFILRPIYNAVTQYKAEKKPVIEKLREIFSRLDSDVFSDKKIAAPELGYTFKNKGELLHAILHTGNQSNFRKLLIGGRPGNPWATIDRETRSMDTTEWDSFKARMYAEGVITKADMDFCQEVWDLNESIKPAAQIAHHDMFGYYFSEITFEPVVTPFGTYKGGYIPAKTDSYLVKSAADNKDKENLLQNNASSLLPATTGKGFTIGRNENYAKSLDLDLGLLAVHIDEVLRLAYMGPAVQDVGRIIGNTELEETFAEINPAWSSEMLVPWLKRTARQTVETKSSGWGGKAADAVFRGLRRRAGLQLMAANIANATQQLTGLFPAMAKVSPRKVGSALVHFTRSPMELTREITGKSAWMSDRLDNEISQISGELRDILTQSKYEKAQDFGMRAGYWASGAAQHIVDVITWQAAYDEKIAEGENEKESVQYADSVVRQTQGSFAPEDASSFEAKSPFVRLFTQFYSYFNMISNLAVTESRNAIAEMGWKGGSPRLFYIYMMTFALPSFLSQLIMAAMRGKIDDDEDGEYIDDVMMMFFTGQARAATALIPGVGQVVNAAVGKFTKLPYDDRMSVSPAVSALEGSVGAGKDLYDVLLDGKELKRAHVRDVFTLAGMITGLPFAAAARPLGYMVAEQSGATEPANNIDYIRGLMTGYAPK